MIRFYQSSHLDALADFCAQLLKKVPLEDAFTPETIVVEQPSMRHWLNLALVKRNGIAANLNSIATKELPAYLTGLISKQTHTGCFFTQDMLHWRLFELLPACANDKTLASLHSQITASEETCFYVAKKIAHCFSRYLVARCDWLEAWQKGQLLGLGEEEAWQAVLWRLLTRNLSPPYTISQLIQCLKTMDRTLLPKRLLLFGITHLEPAYLDLLKSLSSLTDVCGFIVNPCHGYWADTISKSDSFSEAQYESPQRFDVGSQLLSQWGRQGRIFLNQWVSDERIDCRDLDEQAVPAVPLSGSLLSRLQHAIVWAGDPECNALLYHQTQKPANKDTAQNNISPIMASTLKPAVSDEEDASSRLQSTHETDEDRSIHFHVAHSPLREIEILKDQLLAHFVADETLTPDQVLVLAPDINVYASMIQAVFGEPIDPDHIPYRLVGHDATHRHPLLAAFVAFLDMLDSRFVASDVIALLSSEAIQRRFDLKADSLLRIDQWIDQAMIRWGRDAKHRSDYDAPEEIASSWRLGLDRLLLGSLLPADILPDSAPLFGEMLPLNMSFADLQTLSSLGDFFDCLHQWAIDWKKETTAAGWVERLNAALDALFQTDDTEETALNAIRQALFDLSRCVSNNDTEFGLPVCRIWLKQCLQMSVQQGFFRGGLTFSSIGGVQAAPFKMICFIGLNQDVFPEQESLAHLDLMLRNARPTDCSQRDKDCYAFLMLVLSAQQTLYVSWVGRSQYNDETLPPSAVVDDLRDALVVLDNESDGLASHQEEPYTTIHPMQPFSSCYYDGTDSYLTSFNRAYIDGLLEPLSGHEPFASTLPLEDPHNDAIDFDDLLSFWRAPPSTWLSKRLGIYRTYLKNMRPEQEPLVVDASSYQQYCGEWLNHRLKGVETPPIKARFMASGFLPPGLCSSTWLDQIEQDIDFKKPTALGESLFPPIPFEITSLDGLTVRGLFNGLRPSGLWQFLPRKPSENEAIKIWLRYLALQSASPKGVAPKIHLFSQYDCRSLDFFDQKTAQAHLNAWLKWMKVGWCDPLPFFPKTSMAAAKALANNKTRDEAHADALKQFEPDYRGYFSDKEREDNQLVFRQQEPLNYPIFWHLVEDLLVPLVKLMPILWWTTLLLWTHWLHPFRAWPWLRPLLAQAKHGIYPCCFCDCSLTKKNRTPHIKYW